VRGGRSVLDALALDPRARTVAPVVDVDDDLVRARRMTAQALHAQSQIAQVVPARNDDRERSRGRHGSGVARAAIGGQARYAGSPHPGRPASASRNTLATAGQSSSTVWVRPLK